MIKKIIAIRIAGQIKINKEHKETLERLRLNKKYTCSIVPLEHKELVAMIKNVKDKVAFGELDSKTEEKLEKQRGKTKKQNKTKTITTYRLHPPRKGINSKWHYPKGVLGNNKKEINKLIERML